MKCESAGCSEEAVVRFSEVRERTIKEEHHHCEAHAALVREAYLSDNRTGLGQLSTIPDAVAFELDLLVDERKHMEKIMLREVGGKGVLVLTIGYLEVSVLYYCLEDSPFKWLVPHATMGRLIQCLGGKLLVVMIDKINPEGYLEAKATIAHNQEIIELRIRPSDGLCLALLSGVPYLVAEEVLRLGAESGWVEQRSGSGWQLPRTPPT